MVFDRMFLDYDVDNETANKIKKTTHQTQKSRTNYKKHKQKNLLERLQKLLIKDKIVKMKLIVISRCLYLFFLLSIVP